MATPDTPLFKDSFINMKVALIITTYNWKDALSCVLESVLRQTHLPDEVIIADDGSKEDTRQLIENYKIKFPVPLIHSWQEDKGFRAARSRNLAIKMSSSDYLIFIDGDMYLDKSFIHDHQQAACNNSIIQGSRVITSPQRASKIISGEIPAFFSSGISNRVNAISNRWLTKIASRGTQSLRGTKTCNIAFWKKDAVAVNGFNEDFVGWGREDTEFVVRMLNSGCSMIKQKFSCCAYHLYHEENRKQSLTGNDNILNKTIEKKAKICSNGLIKY